MLKRFELFDLLNVLGSLTSHTPSFFGSGRCARDSACEAKRELCEAYNKTKLRLQEKEKKGETTRPKLFIFKLSEM